MNYSQQIQSQLLDLPVDLQVEVLDFIKFVKHQRQIAKPATPLFPPTRLEEVAGCLAYQGKAKSVKEMDAAIAAQFRCE